MEPNVSTEEREILRALVLGLNLCRIDSAWRFGRSPVADAAINGLLEKELVALADSGARLQITDLGREVLWCGTKELISGALKWLRSPDSKIDTS